MTDREQEAENIRQEYLKNSGRLPMPRDEEPPREPAEEPESLQASPLLNDSEILAKVLHESFFKQLDDAQLEALLEAILTELRARGSEGLKRDLLTRTKLLRLIEPGTPPM